MVLQRWISWVSRRAPSVMFGQGANKTALTERESIERPVSPTGCGRRVALTVPRGWRPGSSAAREERFRLAPRATTARRLTVRRCITFGSTLSAHAAMRVTRSIDVSSVHSGRAVKRGQCRGFRLHREHAVQRPLRRAGASGVASHLAPAGGDRSGSRLCRRGLTRGPGIVVGLQIEI